MILRFDKTNYKEKFQKPKLKLNLKPFAFKTILLFLIITLFYVYLKKGEVKMDTCSNGESGIVFNVKLSDLRSDDLKKIMEEIEKSGIAYYELRFEINL